MNRQQLFPEEGILINGVLFLIVGLPKHLLSPALSCYANAKCKHYLVRDLANAKQLPECYETGYSEPQAKAFGHVATRLNLLLLCVLLESSCFSLSLGLGNHGC